IARSMIAAPTLSGSSAAESAAVNSCNCLARSSRCDRPASPRVAMSRATTVSPGSVGRMWTRTRTSLPVVSTMRCSLWRGIRSDIARRRSSSKGPPVGDFQVSQRGVAVMSATGGGVVRDHPKLAVEYEDGVAQLIQHVEKVWDLQHRYILA